MPFGFPLLSTNVAICIKSSPIVCVNHSFRSNLLNYYSSLWNLADSLNPCPGTRTFLVKTEGLGVLSISSLVFLPKELGDFQFNRSETCPFVCSFSTHEFNIVSLWRLSSEVASFSFEEGNTTQPSVIRQDYGLPWYRWVRSPRIPMINWYLALHQIGVWVEPSPLPFPIGVSTSTLTLT